MAKRNLMNGEAVPMEPGERDRAVTIEQMQDGLSDSNVPFEKWSMLVDVVWMRKLDARTSERVKSDQVAASFDTQWEMGYVEDMDPELVDVAKTRRLKYQNRIYQIVGASMIGRREGIELLTLGSTRISA